MNLDIVAVVVIQKWEHRSPYDLKRIMFLFNIDYFYPVVFRKHYSYNKNDSFKKKNDDEVKKDLKT